jgi:hypothetical protein
MQVGLWEYPRLGFMLRFLALIVKTSHSWWLRICFGIMFLSCSQNLSSLNLSWYDLANACKMQFFICTTDTTMLQNNGITHEMACTTAGSTTHHLHAFWAKTLAGLWTSGMLRFDAKFKAWSFIARNWKNVRLLPIFHNK